jgi:hypothetical protein
LRYQDDTGPREPMAARPAYLSPGVLDQINPLPNGRKRVMEGVS